MLAAQDGVRAAPSPQPASAVEGATHQEIKRPPTTAESQAAWRKVMLQKPRPKPEGCFTAEHPVTEWREVPCTKAPEQPYPPVQQPPAGHPPAPWPPPNVVGNGTDFSPQVTGSLSLATGSFDDASTVTSETGRNGAANAYTLQLNANFFTSTSCNGSPNPGACQGWQQFIYDNSGSVFMQYWLVGFGTPCPAGWMTNPAGCFKNSTATSVPVQPLTNFANLTLSGSAANGASDSVTLSTGTNMYSASANDNVVNLSAGWQIAEFNVVGNCCSSQADFNAGSHLIVRTSVNNGTMNAPTSTTQGFTGETNSFTLVPPSCPYGGASPALVFDESTNAGATSRCANGTSIGDTHLTNVNGVLYDFQASGDYLLAQTDSDFVVETRQVSGAPTWPDASVNKAVAMKMGPTRLAVCLDPGRLVVDGKPRSLEPGGSLSLPGVIVVRSGNSYVFTRPDGENVRADLNNGWIDVSVGLGRARVALVHGLLGNVNGNTEPFELATRQGVVLSEPVSFAALYQRYGESWRVRREEGLVSELCGGHVEYRNPERPFYAGNLKPEEYKRGREVCMATGVKEGALLDACTLDVIVLGDKAAAAAHAHAAAPRAVVRVGSHERPR
jgi:hypothetical protein